MTLPDWAIGVFVAVFMAVLAIARWGIKYFADRISTDIGGVGKSVSSMETKIDRRMEEVGNRIEQVDGRMDKRIDRLEGALKHVDSRLWFIDGLLSRDGTARTSRRARTEPPTDNGAPGSDGL